MPDAVLQDDAWLTKLESGELEQWRAFCVARNKSKFLFTGAHSKGYDKGKDFVLDFGDDRVVKFEVKADIEVSSKAALEFQCNHRRSGLATTGAQVWLHRRRVPSTSHWETYCARVADLRRVMFNNKWPSLVQPNDEMVGKSWLRITDNSRSGDKSHSVSFLLNVRAHMKMVPWWKRLDRQKDGTIDWYLFSTGREDLSAYGF